MLKAKFRSDLLVRKVVLDVTSELVKLSPVDTGMFRANWFVGASLPTDTSQIPDKTGASSIARAASMAAMLKAGGTTWIVNNLAYAIPLEYGHSKQAPAGMVRITVTRWQPIVDQAARDLND
ncbi:hypothetical protein [Geothrix terrae]|uniref:hypothetical protein n=1 Tax=Geothrix terrae TaxID=2922720 RepID=UPI001FABD266|nr:hypothetical protein [Geothrix terrae]